MKTNNVVQLLGAPSHGTNLVVLTPTNTVLSKLTTTIVSANGGLGSLFASPLINTNANIVLKGAVLQADNVGYGYFMGTNGQSGAFSIMADPNNTGW